MVRRPLTLSALISLDIGGGLLILGLVLGIVLQQGIREMLDDALHDKAAALARQLATVSLDAALIYDYGTLERYVRDLVAQPGVRYLRVRREDGEVLGEAGTEPLASEDGSVVTVLEPLWLGHNRFGDITVAYDRSRVARAMVRISLAGLLGIAVLTVLLYFIQRRILERRLVRPLQAIALQASPLRHTRPPPQKTLPRELAQISQMLARMCDEVVEHSNRREQARRVAREASERLCKDQRLVVVGQLAAGLAHSLNTPLGNILGYTQQALRGDLDEATRSRLGVIEQQARVCSEIVRKLLASARPPEVASRPIDLAQQVHGIVRLMRPVLQDQGIRRMEVDGEAPCPALADPAGIDQVLYNLLSNAAEARATEIRIRAQTHDGQATLEVQDNGEGVPEDLQTRLFEPFASGKPPGKGTGLGLYLCRTLLSAMGGEIRLLESHPGATAFRITLKVPPKTPEPPETHDQPGADR